MRFLAVRRVLGAISMQNIADFGIRPFARAVDKYNIVGWPGRIDKLRISIISAEIFFIMMPSAPGQVGIRFRAVSSRNDRLAV